jgi:hypothetical protein
VPTPLSLAIAPASLHQLRRRLLNAGTGIAADILQGAGFATGDALFQQWQAHVAVRTGMDDAGALDTVWFGSLFRELLESLGWGALTTDAVGEHAVLLSSANWAEAEPNSSEHPGCYFSCGCLAAFFTAQAGAPLAVLEVELLAGVYDLMAAGGQWRDGL